MVTNVFDRDYWHYGRAMIPVYATTVCMLAVETHFMARLLPLDWLWWAIPGAALFNNVVGYHMRYFLLKRGRFKEYA